MLPLRESAVKPAGKPDAGNPHVRFDERGWETGQAAWPAPAPNLDSTAGSLSDDRIRPAARPPVLQGKGRSPCLLSSGSQQRLFRLGGCKMDPIRIHANSFCQAQGGSPFTVKGVHRSATFNQELHGLMARSPRRHVERRTVRGDFEITVTFPIQR